MIRFLWHWLASGTVREAANLCSQAGRLLEAERDILPPVKADAFRSSIAELKLAVGQGAEKETLRKLMHEVETSAAANLSPHTRGAVRENVEMFLATITVIFAVFTFFVQHFAIPTGSMQPTLYGITWQNHTGEAKYEIPSAGRRIFERWVNGSSYYQLTAGRDGMLEQVEPRRSVFPGIYKQRFMVGGVWQTLWFAPDELLRHADIEPGRMYKQGEDIIRIKCTAGDHLFVDRLTYNFRPPRRGEIVVFDTTGIPKLAQNTFYIKRLIGLGGDTVQIGDDRHLVINGARLDAATPRFESLYSFSGPPQPSVYSGHVNERTVRRAGIHMDIPFFPDGNSQFKVSAKHFLVMGDNTMNSSDSRMWGDFPQEKVIGRAFFVFWPFSSRVGWQAW